MENFLQLTGIVAEAVIVGLLLYRRVARKLPLFLVYCICAVVTDATSIVLRLYFPAWYSIKYFLAEATFDFVLQLCVLVELAWAVLRPLQRFLSSRVLVLIAALVALTCLTIWPFAGLTQISAPSPVWRIVMQMEQTASIVRVLFFLVLAASSQVLSLGWRDRELQVATGFGFYSLVSISVAVANTHQSSAEQFRNLEVFVMAGFVLSLFYWVFCFAQKETARREFTPKMQSSLLALAESAGVTRKRFEEPED